MGLRMHEASCPNSTTPCIQRAPGSSDLGGPRDSGLHPHLGTLRVLCCSFKVPSIPLTHPASGRLTKLLFGGGSRGGGS